MFELLSDFHTRPRPFSYYTASTLWTDPHIAGRMLSYHLDAGHDIASRNPQAIAQIAGWIDARLNLSGKALCDLGCGPGLYAKKFAAYGACVTGLDFSGHSLAYASAAVEDKGMDVTFRQADYLVDPLPEEQDIITLIYGDVCALSYEQRGLLFRRIHASLKPGGALLLDAFPASHFEARTETVEFACRLMDGFWAAGEYYGFSKTFLYAPDLLALDRYLIITPERSFEVFNWMQYFKPAELAAELERAGFQCEEPVDAVTGASWEDPSRMFALLARKQAPAWG